MDITVNAATDAVVAALENAGYAQSTIGQYRKSIKALSRLAEKQAGIYTKELGVEFSEMTTSPVTGKFSKQRWFDYGRLIWLIDSYVDTGVVDLSMRRKRNSFAFSSEDFRQAHVSWRAHMEVTGLAQTTIESYGRIARHYMAHLESLEIWSLDDASGSTVFSFLESLMSTWSRTSLFWILSNFRPFLRFVGKQELLDAVTTLKPARPHKFQPMLSAHDEAAVIRQCCNRSVSRRNAAIALLALTTGMRSCDIINIRIKDIEWRSKCITIIQHKTGNPLTIPLLPAVGNAISEYLLEERPDCEYDHVFVRAVAPFCPLADHASVYAVIRKVFVAAGAADTACGTKKLRHNAASKMLKTGSALPVIAASLGHVSPDTTNIYLTTDDERLKECILPLPTGARS